MNPNKDETRSQSAVRAAVDGRVFSLVLMYDGETISASLMITNTLILVELFLKQNKVFHFLWNLAP